MIRAAVVATAAGVLLLGADLMAQDTPNFAGEWTLITDGAAPAAPAGGRGGRGGRGGMGGAFGGLGQGATITQDATTLRITRTTPMGEVVSVYNLDGSRSTNTLTMAGQSIQQVSTTALEEGRLVITTSMDLMGNPIQTTMALSINEDGELVVRTTAPGRGGGPPTPTELRYRRGS